MTSTEFGFLALGLVLGVFSGAAIVEFLRARPPLAHEVKVTVAHDAIPRRSSTLADDAFTSARPEPARGGPADRRWTDGVMPAGTAERRTTVRFSAAPPTAAGPAAALRRPPAAAIPVGPGPDVPMPGQIMEPALPLTGVPPERPAEPRAELVGVPVSSGTDPMLTAMRLHYLPQTRRRHAAAGAAAVAPALAASVEREATPSRPPTAVGLLDRPAGAGGDQAAAAPASAPVERCAEERRLAEERCELATRARAQADVAADALRQAQRAYEAHEAAALEAASLSDARSIHAAKEAAQGGFRSAVRSAADPDSLEAAARDWLTEINRINTEAKDAAARATREHAAAAEIGAMLDRLGLEADAARIGADNADAACVAARAAVADCDERAISDAAAFMPPPPPPASPLPGLADDETLGHALEAGGAPRIFRLLHGDRVAMTTVVTALAGDDADARRRWQLHLTGLIEAIIADAIQAAYLEFPDEHPFWGSFTRIQNRDISQALSSLGFRFDGLGGWTDNRIPAQRDLSLALGYAGLDPMRVRHWPNEEATAELYHDVAVAADEYLAGVAGDLTLAEMVAMLGRRADGLADVWNQWGRIRPLLLEET